MRIFGITRWAALTAFLSLLTAPAPAAVVVLEAQGSLEHWVLYDIGSHSPCAGASWYHETAEGTTFDLQTTSFDGSCIDSQWAGRCDDGGLQFSGEMLPVPAGHDGWWVHLESQLSVLLELTTPTVISATRSAEGLFSPALHTVIVTLPSGATEVLLGADDESNSVEGLLGAGIHRITFSIETDSTWDAPFSYTGLVEVNWDNPLAQDSLTWGGIKSYYQAGR